MASVRGSQARAGVGLRLGHLAEAAATRPAAAWFEIHPENFLANPHATELLVDIARDYPISVHSVGVSVGSAGGIDRAHLRRVRDLIVKIEPFAVSGHLAWSTHQGEYLNDLLPLPYNNESLRVVAQHVDEVQSVLGRTYLIENPASYVGFRGSTMSETEFFAELVQRTSCRILCDVSNVHVSAHNMGYDAYEYLNGIPRDCVGELHLGGFTPESDDADPGNSILVDTHADRIAEPAWRLYAYALRRFGPKPTLIEWDNDLPAFATLLNEAARADEIAATELASEANHVVAA